MLLYMQLKWDEKKREGRFDGDVLCKRLGTEEHIGRMRGVGSYAPWKYGRDRTKDDKRARKRAKQEKAEQELRQTVKEEILTDLRAEIRQEGTASPTLPSPGLHRSSCGYRDIDVIVACDLVQVHKPSP